MWAAQAAQLSVPEASFDDYYALSRSMSARTLRWLIEANFSFRVPDSVLASGRPALLMAGDREEARLLNGMKNTQTTVRNSAMQIHQGVGHGMPLAQPDRFNAALQGWLKSGRTA